MTREEWDAEDRDDLEAMGVYVYFDPELLKAERRSSAARGARHAEQEQE